MPPIRLFLDANVIYDAHLRDFFLRLHEAELVTIIWSEYALEETRRALIRNGKTADKVDRLITILTSTTVESITPTNRPVLGLPDSADEPIAHAAIDGQADYLVALSISKTSRPTSLTRSDLKPLAPTKPHSSSCSNHQTMSVASYANNEPRSDNRPSPRSGS